MLKVAIARSPVGAAFPLLFSLVDRDPRRPESMLFKFARILSRTVHSLPQYKMVLKLAVFGGLVAVLSQFLGASVPISVGASFAVYLLTGGWRFCRVIIKTLPRDLRYVSVYQILFNFL